MPHPFIFGIFILSKIQYYHEMWIQIRWINNSLDNHLLVKLFYICTGKIVSNNYELTSQIVSDFEWGFYFFRSMPTAS